MESPRMARFARGLVSGPAIDLPRLDDRGEIKEMCGGDYSAATRLNWIEAIFIALRSSDWSLAMLCRVPVEPQNEWLSQIVGTANADKIRRELDSANIPNELRKAIGTKVNSWRDFAVRCLLTRGWSEPMVAAPFGISAPAVAKIRRRSE